MSKIDIPDALVEQLLDLAAERVESAVDDLMEQLTTQIRQALTGKRPSKRRKGGDGTVAGTLASRVMDGETGASILRDFHPASKP